MQSSVKISVKKLEILLNISAKKSSKKLPSFSCPNPDCPVWYCSFNTIKGYQNHLAHHPVCTAYAYTRHPFLRSIDGKPTQPIAMATVPTVAYAQEGLHDSWNSSTLYTGNARVTQHAWLIQTMPLNLSCNGQLSFIKQDTTLHPRPEINTPTLPSSSYNMIEGSHLMLPSHHSLTGTMQSLP